MHTAKDIPFANIMYYQDAVTVATKTIRSPQMTNCNTIPFSKDRKRHRNRQSFFVASDNTVIPT